MSQAEVLVNSRDSDFESGVASGKLAIWLFLASEVMFFAGLICSYIVLRIGSPDWPVPATKLSIGLTGFNTFLLICSSVTMVKALAAAHNNDQYRIKKFLALTVFMGTCFVSVQAYEYYHLWHGHGGPHGLAPLMPSTSLFGGTFYVMTGFHGAHVTGGVIWLTCILINALNGTYSDRYNIPIELAGLYWHFVDLVWIILFTIVYLV